MTAKDADDDDGMSPFDSGIPEVLDGIPVDTWRNYAAYAFTWQTMRYSMPKPHVKAIKNYLQITRKRYASLPAWWGNQSELPF